MALPLGFAAGQAARVLVLLAAVPGRVRSVGRSEPALSAAAAGKPD